MVVRQCDWGVWLVYNGSQNRLCVGKTVLAIELLAACQAMEFIRPLTTTPPLEAIHQLVRTKIPLVAVVIIILL